MWLRVPQDAATAAGVRVTSMYAAIAKCSVRRNCTGAAADSSPAACTKLRDGSSAADVQWQGGMRDRGVMECSA